ncbi:disintegrin and metalloproteinase domain-containing protein 21-like [Erethizon dorsatum]
MAQRDRLSPGRWLLLGLWALLAPGQCLQSYPSWHYISSELVIPRKEMYNTKDLRASGWLSYSLRFGGQRHIIHLRRKRLLWSRNVPVMTQNDQGGLQMDFPYIPSDCYYTGYLEDIPLSMVTVDTCYGGLDGIMKLDDLAYEIKPLKDSSRFEHVVSQIVADSSVTGPVYRLGHREETDSLFSEANASETSRASSKQYAFHYAIIRGYVQIFGGIAGTMPNTITAINFTVKFGNLVDGMIQGLGIRYTLQAVGVALNNPVPLNNLKIPGSPVHQYFLQKIWPDGRPHSFILLLKDSPYELDFYIRPYSVCYDDAIVIAGYLGRHFLWVAVIATQGVARSLGMPFDGPYCTCQRRATCIMYRHPVLTDAFSNCSLLHMFQLMRNASMSCIFNPQPRYKFGVLRCGDSIVTELLEQCDCGTLSQCARDPCCTTYCKYSPGSICDNKECCINCTNAPAGILCRPIRNICDLPEYCSGNSTVCPRDFYLQDGTPCTQEGYCYQGNCTDRNMHCREIFGPNAQNGDAKCYKINTRASRFGHCRRDFTSAHFKACAATDVMCGRLQCANVTTVPKLQDHVSFHQSLIEGARCFGLDEHRATGSIDVGRVRTGTPCASGKFCSGGTCSMNLKALNYDCDAKKCSYRGICNNRKNCHCHLGWSPPICRFPGFGGSVDSGPPPKAMRKVKQSIHPVLYLLLVFGRLFAFIGLLFVGAFLQITSDTEMPAAESSEQEF